MWTAPYSSLCRNPLILNLRGWVVENTHLFICWLSFEDEAVAYPKYSQSLQNHLRENPVAKNLVLLTPEQ